MSRRALPTLTSATVAAALLTAGLAAAAPAAAAVPTVQQRSSNAVTADALPTAQINGVAWAQVIVGDTVFVGGSFTSARPAGSPAGTNETSRTDLMAYSLSTGVMTSWAPVLNNQVKSLAVSPDGKTLYAGGQFTSVNGKNRQRLAAFDVASGALLTNFQPSPNYIVDAVVATASTVYLGGEFTSINGLSRSRLAAATAATGAVTAWNPGADSNVDAMVMAPAGDKLVVGGLFGNLAGQAATGLGAVDPTTGAGIAFAANARVHDSGTQAGITSLRTDGTSIYGTGYTFGGGGNFEGLFRASPTDGSITWLEDCHGDSYDSYPDGDTVYVVNHAHFCGDVGGFPQTDPDVSKSVHHFALAFTTATNGTLAHNPYKGYADWYGTAAPALVNWFPDLVPGSFTGQGQAAWTVTGSGSYVVMGGEFPSVNGQAQQGLVRFAKPPVSPAALGPKLSYGAWKQTVKANFNATVTVSFRSNYDQDDATLTYTVARNSTTNIIYTTSANSTFWNRPTITFTDTAPVRGISNGYLIYATDSNGNRVASNTVYVAVPR